MAETFIEKMRGKLLQQQQQLEVHAAAGADSSKVVELDQSRVGRLSRMDAMQSQAMAQASGRRRQLMQKKVAVALARIDNGSYGICRSCEEEIPRMRLEFDPAADLCVDCAASAES